nr:MAG TPA: hypothetical protein [Caudoviricetes sp.]
MMTVFIKFKELKSLDFIHTVFFCLEIKERGQDEDRKNKYQ